MDCPSLLFGLLLLYSPGRFSAHLFKAVLSFTCCKFFFQNLGISSHHTLCHSICIFLSHGSLTLWLAQTSTVCLGTFYYIKYFILVFLHRIPLCTLGASTCYTHTRTCSLVTSLCLFKDESSLMISVLIMSSFMLFMN